MAESPSRRAAFVGAFEREAANTRRMLERVPDDKFDWRPHPKSMPMGRLAHHISDLMGRAPRVLQTESVDLAAGAGQARPNPPANGRELLEGFDQGVAAARAAMEAADGEQLRQTWTMRRGDQILISMPRRAVLQMQLSHAIHHRGQLSVYLRLNDIPVPGMYGPSADEH